MPSLSFRAPSALLAIFVLVTTYNTVEAQPPAKRPPWTTSKVQGSPTPPEPYRLVAAYPQAKFTLPTSLEEYPGHDQLLITERDGKVFALAASAADAEATLLLDLKASLPADLREKAVSLWDAEFHPDFAANGVVYLCYVHPGNGGHTRVSRFQFVQSDHVGRAPKIGNQILPDSEQIIITWPSGGHNGGCLEFGPDGYLYISTGDGTGPNPPDGLTTGQDVSDLLGAILRIDVNKPEGDRPYSIPADNPFVAMDGARPEIWAYGLRNPWKFGIDPKTGDCFAADNGWESWEMVHRIVRGGNCGWPVMEGRASLRSEVKVGPTPIRPPAKDHPHSEANSVIGGPIYRGAKLPQLQGSFVYGDYITGTLWAIRPDQENSYSHETLCDTDQRIIAFTETRDGRLLVLDYDLTGQIYELQPSGLKDTTATFPRKLSQTGLFADLKTMTPATGVVPYDVTVERWLDGADAQRWVAIPGDGKIQLASGPDDSATYPEGTVFAKHLAASSSATPLETQLLHFENGKWNPYSYLWNDDKSDAELVSANGASRSFSFDAEGKVDPRTWHVNAVNECKLCHNAGPKFVLGFTRHQLNQRLDSLSAAGVIEHSPPVADNDPSRLVDAHDESQSLEDRARSYLHGNCAMCHHPGGNAIVSFYLRRDLPFDKLNTNKGTGIGTFGLRDAKIIVPGDPLRSVLMYRMSKLGYARMPYIGSRVVDGYGVELVHDWIKSLPPAPGAEPPTPEPMLDDDGSNVARLMETTGGALGLEIAAFRGDFSPVQFASVVKAGNGARSDVRGLFETFIPEAQRRPTLGATVDPQVILSKTGDLERGKLIFYSDGARCRNCHELNDPAKSLGPTLHEVAKKYPDRTELVRHALLPSLKIDEPYAAYSAVTSDGRTISGLVVERTEREVVIKTAEKQLVRLAVGDIEDLTRSPKSLMPDRILADLTAQEAADLFEYVASHREPPTKPAPP